MTRPTHRFPALLAVALTILLLVPSVARAGGPPVTATPFQQQQQSIQELRGLTGPALEIGFIDRTIPHHQSAIQMAMVIATKAVHPEVRAVAQMVIMTQREEIAQLTDDLRTRYGRTVQPDTRFMMQPSEMAMLQQASPRMAEKMFMLMMREHHQSLNDMAQVVVQQGAPHVEFRDLALHMLGDQVEQQGQLYTLLRDLYGITPPAPTGNIERGMQFALGAGSPQPTVEADTARDERPPPRSPRVSPGHTHTHTSTGTPTRTRLRARPALHAGQVQHPLTASYPRPLP